MRGGLDTRSSLSELRVKLVLNLFGQRPIILSRSSVRRRRDEPMPFAPAALLDMLIVDDDADTRELLAEHCAARGFRVATAQDGRAATVALERARPPFPVVVADLHLPHADGFAVLDAARRANASCYVIMITGYATIDSAVR